MKKSVWNSQRYQPNLLTRFFIKLFFNKQAKRQRYLSFAIKRYSSSSFWKGKLSSFGNKGRQKITIENNKVKRMPKPKTQLLLSCVIYYTCTEDVNFEVKLWQKYVKVVTVVVGKEWGRKDWAPVVVFLVSFVAIKRKIPRRRFLKCWGWVRELIF